MTTTLDDLQLTVLASPAVAGLARTLINARLQRWRCSHMSDDALLIATELVTNAAKATPGMPIRVRMSRDRGEVVLAVWDSSDRTPTVNPPQAATLDGLDVSPEHWDDNGGWGLPIVAALATDCGYEHEPSGGKWVWARLKP